MELMFGVFSDSSVQGGDLVHELLALVAVRKLIGLGSELVNRRQELIFISVH